MSSGLLCEGEFRHPGFCYSPVNANATAQQLVAVKVAAAVAAKHKYRLHFSSICTAASRPEPSHITAPLIAPLHFQRTNLDQRDVSITKAWKIQKQELRDQSTRQKTYYRIITYLY